VLVLRSSNEWTYPAIPKQRRNERDIGRRGKHCQASVTEPLDGNYFGCIDWSPPGVPGGGITGIAPPGGVGCLISGSTFFGGQITPPERASLSLRFPCASCWSDSAPLPIVLGVSDCAHAFGSSCSAFGATGGLVVGGACATAAVGNRTAAVTISQMRIPRIMLPSALNHVDRPITT